MLYTKRNPNPHISCNATRRLPHQDQFDFTVVKNALLQSEHRASHLDFNADGTTPLFFLARSPHLLHRMAAFYNATISATVFTYFFLQPQHTFQSVSSDLAFFSLASCGAGYFDMIYYYGLLHIERSNSCTKPAIVSLLVEQ